MGDGSLNLLYVSLYPHSQQLHMLFIFRVSSLCVCVWRYSNRSYKWENKISGAEFQPKAVMSVAALPSSP